MKKIIYFQIYAWFAKKYTIKVDGNSRSRLPRNSVIMRNIKMTAHGYYTKINHKYNRGNYENVRIIIEEEVIKFDKYLSRRTINRSTRL